MRRMPLLPAKSALERGYTNLALVISLVVDRRPVCRRVADGCVQARMLGACDRRTWHDLVVVFGVNAFT